MYQLLIAFIISISVVLAATTPLNDRGVVGGGGVQHGGGHISPPNSPSAVGVRGVPTELLLMGNSNIHHGGIRVDPGREGVKRSLFGENGHGILKPPPPSSPTAFDRGIKGVPTASLIKGKDSIAYGAVKHGGVHMTPPTTPIEKLTRVLRPGENGHGIKQPPATFHVNGGVVHHGGAHLDPELNGGSPNIHHDPTPRAITKDQGKMPRGAKMSPERFIWVNDDADDQQTTGDDDDDDGDDFDDKIQFDDDFINQLISGLGDDDYYYYDDAAAVDDAQNDDDDANNDDTNVGGDDTVSTILSLQSFMTSFFSPRSPLPRSSGESNLRGSSGNVMIFSSYSSSSSPGSMFVSYFPSDADRKSSATPCDFMPAASAQQQATVPVLTSVDASFNPTTEMDVQGQQVDKEADFFDQYGLYLAFASGLMFSAAISSFLYYSRTVADISKPMPVKGEESSGKLECQSSISDVADPSKFLFAIKSVPVQPPNVDGK